MMASYMDYVYVLVMNDHGFGESATWEDVVVFLSQVEAVEKSKKYSDARVEIFSISREGGYRPTYTYYKNGVFYGN